MMKILYDEHDDINVRWWQCWKSGCRHLWRPRVALQERPDWISNVGPWKMMIMMTKIMMKNDDDDDADDLDDADDDEYQPNASVGMRRKISLISEI